MKNLSLSLVLVITLLSFGTTFAYANQPYDTALQLQITPKASTIKKGTDVTLTFRIVNVGTKPIVPVGMLGFAIPQELEVQSINFSYDTGVCYIPDGGTPVIPGYEDHDVHICNSASEWYALPILTPGQFHTITIQTKAVKSFTSNVTRILGLHFPSEEEPDHETYTQLEEIEGALMDSIINNVVTYKYVNNPTTTKASPARTPTQNNPTSPSTSSSTTNTQTMLGEAANQSNEGTTLLDDTLENSETTEQAEVASEIQDRLPERVISEDKGTLSALFSGRYKAQFLIGTIILVIGSGVAYSIRRRYLKSRSSIDEYNKALKAKKIKTQFLDTDEQSKLEERV